MPTGGPSGAPVVACDTTDSSYGVVTTGRGAARGLGYFCITHPSRASFARARYSGRAGYALAPPNNAARRIPFVAKLRLGLDLEAIEANFAGGAHESGVDDRFPRGR